ncbi:hypothetical protein DH2020_031500 [Rehmannia glutinosa]|uniref:Uncharacterized protein n=1 Tax=Rehmannia glutinosa TaxID=99300 RepID=A0ABR0VI08_REHGL
MATLLETCGISPPTGNTADQLTVPLTFFDIPWMNFHPIRHLLFYDYPCSKAYFLETLVPKLKQSLSLTLKHYLPLSGNLLYPLNTVDEKPVFRYVAGDSVSLAIAESNNDFDELVGNLARDADQFYDFVPELPPVKLDESNYQTVPVIALQVTLFPGRGICIGFSNHHCVGDASSIVGFIRAWASISKLDEDEFLTMPIFDRSVIKDPLGIDNILCKKMKVIPLKSWSFLCLVKSGEELVDDDVLECFIFMIDLRAHISPPVPPNYFGNCLGCGKAKIEHKQLFGEEGFVIAVEAIAEEIKNKVNKKDQVLKGAENRLSGPGESREIRALGVSGSPKFDLCSADFGWGKVKKLEVLSIDGEKYTMSLCKSTDSEGGLEVGLSLPKERMEAFAAIFAQG